jgi:hypothetical protein
MISLNLYWAVVYFYEEPWVVDLKSKLKCLDFGSTHINGIGNLIWIPVL